MKILNEIRFLINEAGESRELSPHEIDAVERYGYEYAVNFSIDGPTGERY
jgi:hypothetical protein